MRICIQLQRSMAGENSGGGLISRIKRSSEMALTTIDTLIDTLKEYLLDIFTDIVVVVWETLDQGDQLTQRWI